MAVPVPLAETFDYVWSDEGPAPMPGCRVAVPFGRSRRVGLVIESAGGSDVPKDRLKAVLEPLDREPLVGGELLATLRWAADYYHHPIGEVVRHAIPGLLRKGRPSTPTAEPAWRLATAAREEARTSAGARARRQALALERLASGPATSAELRRAGVTRAVLTRLVEKGMIERLEGGSAPAGNATPAAPDRGPVSAEPPPELTPDQARVLEAIAVRAPGYAAFLLHGVTGSGKTEVFLRLISEQLAAARQTLLLVPEIGLTPQLVARLRARLGDRLAIVHSGLGDAERLDAWRRARSGEAGVVVGTRSAVFAELAAPGLVIVDEEHDLSYKQQQGFRYSARDVAVVRARRLGIPIVLASATPSLESVHNARTGRYRRLEMPSRIGAGGQPRVVLVDLNRHAARGVLSTPLVAAVERHLSAGQQVLLFLNRRGFAPVLFCPTCRDVEQCGRCDARLTVHAGRAELRCHHCGAAKPLRFGCARCGSERIAVGAGTERVTQELQALFPERRIGRLDRDATARKGALDSVLADVQSGATRILVGTQMLTKGHDFPNVTLVGVLNADQGLFGTELRSDERLAQTIVQVAGRAGRRDTPGEVLIQTHYPEHPLLARLLTHGYAAFAELALEERRRAGWPPHSHLALWRAEAAQRGAVFALLERVAAESREATESVEVLGPAPDPMERKAGRFRGRLLLRSSSRPPLHALLARLVGACRTWPESRRARWSIDVDPVDT
ncbi:MAG TPA: primosomal protein N' [Gammaproteobacteria bacterium]|nr:primosomal protein N' [Gammaproteobacteria bacterium]